MKIFKNEIIYFEVLIFSVLCFLYYNFTFNIHTDIELHAQFIKDYAYGNKPFQVNFLYYLTVYFFSFFSSKTSGLLVISVYVLTIATFLKYYITKNILLSELKIIELKEKRLISIISFFILFLFPIPVIYFFTNYYYLLSSTPTIWHNSTTIFAMPFVLLLFWNSYLQLQNHSTKRLLIIFLLIVLNAVAKPSFLFVFFIVYPVFLLLKYKFKNKLFWFNLIPIVSGAVVIFLEYLQIFLYSEGSSSSSVVINFFYFFKNWSQGNNIYLLLFLSVLSSFLFPIILLLKNRGLFKNNLIIYSLSCIVVALLISITFCETGIRVNDGNFEWQVFMCSYLLFFSSILELLKLIKQNNYSLKKYFIEILFLTLHIVSGIIYLINIFITKSYF